jgi:plastocyanin
MHRISATTLRVLALLLFVTTCRALTVTVYVGGNGNSFAPASFTINPGDTVKWVWAAGYHNTSSYSIPAGAMPWTENITSTSTSWYYVPTVSGLYRYTCTYHSGMDGQFFVTGCTFPDKPQITASGGGTACDGDSVLLSVASQPGTSYQWINGTTSIAQATNPTFMATTPGSYKVVVNRCGVDSISAPFAVSFHSLPSATVSYASTGLEYFFTASITGVLPYRFRWNFGDGTPEALSQNPAHTFATAGNYTVVLTLTDSVTGCQDTFQRMVAAEALSLSDAQRVNVVAFPNPAQDKLFINELSEGNVRLLNAHGRSVNVGTEKWGTRLKMNVQTLPRGLYFLEMRTSTGRTVKPVLLTD